MAGCCFGYSIGNASRSISAFSRGLDDSYVFDMTSMLYACKLTCSGVKRAGLLAVMVPMAQRLCIV